MPKADSFGLSEKGCPRHLRPLVAAVNAGRCGLVMVTQHVGSFDLPLDDPLVLILGDDLMQAFGPDAFDRTSLIRVLSACKVVALVSSSPDDAFYADAIRVASVERRHVAIIETRLTQEQPWLDFIAEAHPGAEVRICTVAPAGSA